MLTGSSFLSYSNAPLQSIRDAIKDSEHHVVRVNEEGTGEIYDLDLSHSAPYASPVNRRSNAGGPSKAVNSGCGGGDSAAGANEKSGATDQTTPSEKEPTRSRFSGGNQGHAQQSSGPVSSGRRILQLPQIVSRRHAHTSSSGQAATSEANAVPEPSSEKEGMIDTHAVQPSQPHHMLPHVLRRPIAGELPPSPPLEADMQQYISASDVPSADSKYGQEQVPTTSESTNAQTGAIVPPRMKPRRAATTNDSGPVGYHSKGSGLLLREPSAASTGSTAYLTASSHGSDSDGESNVEVHVSATFSQRYLTTPLTAEPTSVQLLHPASAAAMQQQPGSADQAARPRSPLKANGNAHMKLPAPIRRNTTGTSALGQSSRRRPGSVGSEGTRESRRNSREREGDQHPSFFEEAMGTTTSSSQLASPGAPVRTGDAGFDDAIAKKYDQIRRERETKKIREQQTVSESKEGESNQQTQENVLRGGAALARARSGRRQTLEEPKALIGNVISEGHVNYVLMYNMLTGIRIGVSRCQAKMKRPLTDADYTAKHKFTFDIIGNELTPSAKYDFKFKDYAPWVFRELREYFHLDAADYLLSLTAKYILSELGSPGKSGSFFYFSRDYRFIIKTIRRNEHKFLRRILKDYHLHIKENPHTLLSRFYGLHRVKLPGGKKIHFVIMNNLFPPHKDIHETYDLKGSAVGREYPEEKAAQKKGAVLKDLNWIKRGRELEFGPAKRALLEAQIRSDVALLQRLGIMDYSLLIGLHDMKRGNKEGLRQDALQVVQPDSNPSNSQVMATSGPPGQLRREPTTRMEKEAYALRAAVRRSDAKALGSTSTAKLPERETSDRHHFLFYQDEGGFRSTNESNAPTDWIYYFGIIDTLTLYNGIKRSEHYWKSLTHNSQMISAIHPVPYGNRFCNFLFSLIKGADTSKRPRMQ